MSSRKRRKKSDSQWWPRYVGDYGRKTEHLSLAQHGAYALLLDWYYANAKPLPLEWVQLHRICKAVAPTEQDAVNTIVLQYFTQTLDGWRNSRADEELEIRKGISDVRRAAQAEKERKRLASEGANACASEGANVPASDPTSTSTLKRSIEDTNVSSIPPTPRKRSAKPLVETFTTPDWVPSEAWEGFVEHRRH